MSNLAGKAGSAIAPVVSEMCKEADKGLISFAVMPFKYEKGKNIQFRNSTQKS